MHPKTPQEHMEHSKKKLSIFDGSNTMFQVRCDGILGSYRELYCAKSNLLPSHNQSISTLLQDILTCRTFHSGITSIIFVYVSNLENDLLGQWRYILWEEDVAFCGE